MASGLPLQRIINIGINLTPAAAQGANLNSLLIIGSTDVVDVGERLESFGQLSDVLARGFQLTDPEYLAAQLFFSQVPQPTQLYIGRWARVATYGLLIGGILSATQQTLATWTAITNGAVQIVIDGVNRSLTSLNFGAQTSLNGVAAVITTALGVNGTCVWNGKQFIIKSATTGTSSSVAYATAGASGTDISVLLQLTSALASRAPVAGVAAESAVACVTAMDQLSTSWYMMMFADTHLVDADTTAIAAYIEGASTPHVFLNSTNVAGSIDPVSTTDIGYVLKQLLYKRTMTQYSQNLNAEASFAGRATTVDFNGNATVITMMFKAEPGIAAENLTTNQADALKNKNINVYTTYNNGASILQYGIMASGDYFDVIFGLDWLKTAIQTAVFNLLNSTNKVPQTDSGNHLIANTIEGVCKQGVANGLIAPGVWTAGGFGNLQTGQFLDKGYYVYQPLVSAQSAADRQARKSVPFQVAVKLAGAVHEVDATINVNQ